MSPMKVESLISSMSGLGVDISRYDFMASRFLLDMSGRFVKSSSTPLAALKLKRRPGVRLASL